MRSLKKYYDSYFMTHQTWKVYDHWGTSMTHRWWIIKSGKRTINKGQIWLIRYESSKTESVRSSGWECTIWRYVCLGSCVLRRRSCTFGPWSYAFSVIGCVQHDRVFWWSDTLHINRRCAVLEAWGCAVLWLELCGLLGVYGPANES